MAPGPALALALVLATGPAADQQPSGPPQPERRSSPSPDGRRTTSQYPLNLGRNLVGVPSIGNLPMLTASAALAGAATTFDQKVKGYFAPTRRAQWLGDFVDYEGQPQVIAAATIALYVAGRLSSPSHQRFRDATYDIGQVVVVDVVYSQAIKWAAHRERPNGANDMSFPSGHTSNAFSWATVVAHYYGVKLAIPAYAFAALVGVGRLEKNAHYLSDVVAGGLLGIVEARTVIRKDGPSAAKAPHVALGVERAPLGPGAGLRVAVSF
jgi:PAP2 superfamily